MFLNCHSYYSLRYGTMSVEELVQKGADAGATALALTDINATTGVYDFLHACESHRIKPLVGIDFWDQGCKYVGLAQNREGFKELNEILTDRNFSNGSFPDRPEVQHCFIIYPLGEEPDHLREYEYIGVRQNQINKVLRSTNREKMVIFQTVTLATARDHRFHQLLRSINENTLITKIGEYPQAGITEYFHKAEHLLSAFKSYPEIIRNTHRLIEDCNFTFDFSTPKNKKYYTGSRYSDRLLLERLANEGMIKRYGTKNREAQDRVRNEVEVIDRMGFAGYFLITWDIVRYSQSRGFFHVGRGSGANSVVSYCLGITNICPIELNLYFERFLNSSRKSPPDFDIDWSWKDRDDILDYIFKRFDNRCTAFTGTLPEFKYRSTVREIGKVLGLPKEELDVLSKQHPDHAVITDPLAKKVLQIGRRLRGFPNQRSMHSCGVIISEEPITYYTALDMPPKGFPTTQFDMYIGEDIGFEKFDILSQRGIGHINDCVEIIQENRGDKLDIHDTGKFKSDPALNRKLSDGETLGCFYIESPAMRGLLRRLKCDNYPTLVAASSVIRPGVAKSGMMREYIHRHNHPDDFQFFHPVFEEQLGETYGIMVYQEDVIKIAQGFAGLDPTDGDILRRAMSGKTRSISELDQVKEKFLANCRERGHPDDLTHEVYRQIESFAGYSFCKAHSASYAVESYQSLFLKTYYPVEFMVAVINNFGGFYRTEVYAHEAKRAGAKVHTPCINTSEYLTIARDKDIYLGFVHLEGLDQQMLHDMLEERMRHGSFTSLSDYIDRTSTGLEQLQTLIYIGAFRFTGRSKSELVIEARMRLTKNPRRVTRKLFEPPTKTFTLPQLDRTPLEDAYDELELFGFPVSCSAFELLRTKFRGEVFVEDLLKYENQVVRMVGYLISQKPVPTARGLMYFGTWIDARGEYFDTTHFPNILQQYPFTGAGCYLLKGKVTVDLHFPTVEITQMAKLPFLPDPRYGDTVGSKERRSVNNDINPWIPQRAPYPSKADTKKSFNGKDYL